MLQSNLTNLTSNALLIATIKNTTYAGVPAVLKFLKFQSCSVIVLKFEILVKSQSFSTNVLILTIVVRAQ